MNELANRKLGEGCEFVHRREINGRKCEKESHP